MSESLGRFGRCVFCGRRIGFWSAIRVLGILGGDPMRSGRCWRCRLVAKGYEVEASPRGYCLTLRGYRLGEYEDEEAAWRGAEDAWRRATFTG